MTSNQDSHLEETTLPIPYGGRVLVLRTAQWPLMNRLLEALENQKAEIVLLIQESERLHLPKNKRIQPIFIRSGYFSFFTVGIKTLFKCRSFLFDTAFVPLSKHSTGSYENVLGLIPLLTSAPAFAVTRNGDLIPVTKKYPFGFVGAFIIYFLSILLRPFGILLMILVLVLLFLFFKTLRLIPRRRH